MKRFIVPVAVSAGLRIVGAVSLYLSFTASGGQLSTPWMDFWLDASLPEELNGPSRSSWLYLFHAWDSAYYVSVARGGYYHPVYVFLPAYPILIRFVGMVIGDYFLAGFLLTQFFGLASVVTFQLLAEHYMSTAEAKAATLLMATFPLVALFTIIGYSEAMFLFSSTATWYFYRKEKVFTASVFAALTSLTRPYGVAIALPIVIDLIRTKNSRKSICLAVPAFAVFSWLFFCFLSTGDAFISWTDENHWKQSGVTFGLVETLYMLGAKGGFYMTLLLTALASLGLLIIVFILIRVWKIDESLFTYPATVFVLLLFLAPISSLPRYLAFIFPIWLILKLRNPCLVSFLVVGFASLTLVLWSATLHGIFIA